MRERVGERPGSRGGPPMLMIVFRCFFPRGGEGGGGKEGEEAGGRRMAGMRMGRDGTGKRTQDGKWSVEVQVLPPVVSEWGKAWRGRRALAGARGGASR